ncbi:uncharacterized protein EAE97_010908 [Botrytis byssoidea]|uniref:Uncharacterized protein n=1 Tax=Botrytis byssoidea TaxID=139641 RepID=A0A9P5HXQ7_9HELO|nr:uncharacterized protein EAE97_010908 [Botrytis byssoidea]KAF7923470.1 hypothetical protein EAE97_010908 [Botrytis byssoidea]
MNDLTLLERNLFIRIWSENVDFHSADRMAAEMTKRAAAEGSGLDDGRIYKPRRMKSIIKTYMKSEERLSDEEERGIIEQEAQEEEAKEEEAKEEEAKEEEAKEEEAKEEKAKEDEESKTAQDERKKKGKEEEEKK